VLLPDIMAASLRPWSPYGVFIALLICKTNWRWLSVRKFNRGCFCCFLNVAF